MAGQTRNGRKKRDRVAYDDARKVAEFFEGFRGLSAVMGDWNSVAQDDSLAPLRDQGWTCNQLDGKRIPTHGRWAPDHVWWRKDKRISYVRQVALDGTRSDHRPLLVTFELVNRKAS